MGRTLITGGAGYIGIELVDELLQAGREVTVLDRLLHGQTDRAQELRERGVTVVEGDIRDTVARGHALHGAEAWRRSSATRPARVIRSSPTRSTSTRASRSPPTPSRPASSTS